MRPKQPDHHAHEKTQSGKVHRKQYHESSGAHSPSRVVQHLLNPLPKAHGVDGSAKLTIHNSQYTGKTKTKKSRSADAWRHGGAGVTEK